MNSNEQAVVVTGAGGGMGVALVEKLADLGWQVVAVDHNATRLSQLLSPKVSKHVHAVCLDLQCNSLESAIQEALSEGVVLGGVVNLAGVSVGDSIESLTDEDWQTTIPITQTTSAPVATRRICGKVEFIDLRK